MWIIGGNWAHLGEPAIAMHPARPGTWAIGSVANVFEPNATDPARPPVIGSLLVPTPRRVPCSGWNLCLFTTEDAGAVEPLVHAGCNDTLGVVRINGNRAFPPSAAVDLDDARRNANQGRPAWRRVGRIRCGLKTTRRDDRNRHEQAAGSTV